MGEVPCWVLKNEEEFIQASTKPSEKGARPEPKHGVTKDEECSRGPASRARAALWDVMFNMNISRARLEKELEQEQWVELKRKLCTNRGWVLSGVIQL